MKRGKLIYLESGEGGGKGIQTKFICEYLTSKGIKNIRVREPGGERDAEKIRNILLPAKNDWSFNAEMYLFQASRAQLYDKVVIPKLEEGVSVVQDRSGDSSVVYQGYARRGDIHFIKQLNYVSTRGSVPDLGIIIDVDPIVGLEKEVGKDRFGKVGLEFHQKVREGYLEIARENPGTYVVVPYIENGLEEMQGEISRHLDKLYGFDLDNSFKVSKYERE